MAQEKQVTPVAAIDIGTNTVLLLVGKFQNGRLITIDEAQQLPRLGRDVDSNGVISDDAVSRVIEAITVFQDRITQKFGTIPIKVTATSAVRDAENRDEVVRRITSATGLEVMILTGRAEAELTYHGALSMVDPTEYHHAVIDIGGGSTEIISGSHTGIDRAVSLNIGCVRFSERFLPQLPVREEQIERCRSAVSKELHSAEINLKNFGDVLTGVAGTVTSLAALHQDLEGYDPARINSHIIPLDEIEKMLQWIASCTKEKLEASNPTVMKGRADIMSAGMIILTEVMKFGGFAHLRVSTGGLRHGILLESFS